MCTFLLCLFRKEAEDGGADRTRPKEGGEKALERAQGVANDGKRSGAELSRRVWKALVWLKARVKRRGRDVVRSRRVVKRTCGKAPERGQNVLERALVESGSV